jgi:hypothetical protein
MITSVVPNTPTAWIAVPSTSHSALIQSSAATKDPQLLYGISIAAMNQNFDKFRVADDAFI